MRRLLAIAGVAMAALALGWWHDSEPAAAPVAVVAETETVAAVAARAKPSPDHDALDPPPLPAAIQTGPARGAGTDWSDPAHRLALLEDVVAGRRSLLSLQTEARLACGARCNGFPEDDLARLPDESRRALQNALAAKAAIERRLSELRLSTDRPLRERFERVKAVRREQFGDEVATRLYGEEEAQMGFRLALADFARGEAAKLAFEARLARVEALRRQHYGDFYPYLDAGENQWERLRQTEAVALAGVPDADRPALLDQLRRVFLGEEEAAKLAAQDAFDRMAAQRAEGYRQAKDALMADLQRRGDPANDPQLAAERDSRLQDLRRRWFNDQG